jgi:hypothetical protein
MEISRRHTQARRSRWRNAEWIRKEFVATEARHYQGRNHATIQAIAQTGNARN